MAAKHQNAETLAFIVVKSLLKASKIHGEFNCLYSVIHHSSISGAIVSALTKRQSTKSQVIVNSFQELACWVEKKVPKPHGLTLANAVTYQPEQELYQYITMCINQVLHDIFEPRGISHRKLGMIGQLAYTLSCQMILKDKYHTEDDTRDLSEIHDPEELKSRLFRDYLNNNATDDYGVFLSNQLSSLSDGLRDNLLRLLQTNP